jgi:hypothetical protein
MRGSILLLGIRKGKKRRTENRLSANPQSFLLVEGLTVEKLDCQTTFLIERRLQEQEPRWQSQTPAG